MVQNVAKGKEDVRTGLGIQEKTMGPAGPAGPKVFRFGRQHKHFSEKKFSAL